MTEIERLTEAVQKLIVEVRALQENFRPGIVPLEIESDGRQLLRRNIGMLAQDSKRGVI